jgi:uroporphyrinogen III methyltransferase/synthase
MTPDVLAQKRYLVTRPEGQSAGLAARLRERGAVPLLAPMLVIAETADPAALAAALDRLDQFDLAVFVSPSAIEQVFAAWARGPHAGRPWPTTLTVAVTGPASRAALLAHQVSNVLCPATRHDSEGLLELPELQQMHGKRVVIFRGNGGRPLLADTLTARGATVELVEAYRRLPPNLSPQTLASLIEAGCDGVLATSSEAVEQLFRLADGPTHTRLLATPFFVSHPRIAEVATSHGVSQAVLTGTGDAAIVDAIVNHVAAQTARAALPTSSRRRWPRLLPWAIGTLVVSLALSAWLIERRLDRVEYAARQQLAALVGEQQAVQARFAREEGLSRQLQAQLALMEAQHSQLRVRLESLEGLYGTLAGDRAAMLLADAELTLGLAAQQLQLTGDVSGALTALYRLDERMAGGERRLEGPRRALARDIQALKRLPAVDLAGLSARLDSLATSIDRLPLRVDATLAEDREPSGASPDEGWWTRLMRDVGSALGAFVSIRRLDDPNDALLLAPEQALYVREHVKLRLLNARLALMQHDPATFRQDLTAAEAAISRHFDHHTKSVQATLGGLRELMAVQPALELPTLADSLAAVRDARRSVAREDNR